MTEKLERRQTRGEVRVKADDKGAQHIDGYATVFNVSYNVGWFDEMIMPGAFTKTLQEKADVRCLFNHDDNWILGRSKSGTLVCSEDNIGLKYSCAPPSGMLALHVTDAIGRGDVDGSSFGFIVRKQEWIDEFDKDGRIASTTRRVLEADLIDVSPVVFPANEAASSGLRSLWPQGMPTEVRAHKSKRDENCQCDCPECADGDCEDCSDPTCTDTNCEGSRSKAKPGEQAPDVAAEAAARAAQEAAANVTALDDLSRAARMRVIQATL